MIFEVLLLGSQDCLLATKKILGGKKGFSVTFARQLWKYMDGVKVFSWVTAVIHMFSRLLVSCVICMCGVMAEKWF